jgi:hypothetical protein
MVSSPAQWRPCCRLFLSPKTYAETPSFGNSGTGSVRTPGGRERPVVRDDILRKTAYACRMKSLPLTLLLGMGLLAVGTGPLLLFVAADEMGLVSDPNPNPVGLGLLFVTTIIPALALTLFGLMRWVWVALK